MYLIRYLSGKMLCSHFKKIEEYQEMITTSCADQYRIVSEVNECEASVNKLQNSIQELESKILEHVGLKQKVFTILN